RSNPSIRPLRSTQRTSTSRPMPPLASPLSKPSIPSSRFLLSPGCVRAVRHHAPNAGSAPRGERLREHPSVLRLVITREIAHPHFPVRPLEFPDPNQLAAVADLPHFEPDLRHVLGYPPDEPGRVHAAPVQHAHVRDRVRHVLERA